MFRKIKKRWIIILSIILLLFVYSAEKRSFYCLKNGKCVTVWIYSHDHCYVIPYKYYGLIKPSDNYIITKDPSDIDIYWVDNDIIARVEKPGAPNYKIINKSKSPMIYDYNEDEKKYSNIIFEGSGRYATLRQNVNRIGITIDGNSYADSKISSTVN